MDRKLRKKGQVGLLDKIGYKLSLRSSFFDLIFNLLLFKSNKKLFKSQRHDWNIR
jgi:hypothetical protein